MARSGLCARGTAAAWLWCSTADAADSELVEADPLGCRRRPGRRCRRRDIRSGKRAAPGYGAVCAGRTGSGSVRRATRGRATRPAPGGGGPCARRSTRWERPVLSAP